MSLRTRLTVGTALALALAISAASVISYAVMRGQLRGEIDASLRGRAAAARSFPKDGLPASSHRPPRANVPAPKLGAAGGYFQQVDAKGKTSLPPNEHDRLPVGNAAAIAAGRHGSEFSEAWVAGTHVRIYTTKVQTGVALQIARPLTEVDHALGQIRLLLIAVSLGAIAAAAMLGLAVARATLRPVRRLTAAAERIASSRDLADRADNRGPDETRRLAAAFNTMLDALAQSVSSQRQLVADASHELRTPLASARTNLEVLELHEGLPAAERRRILTDAIAELGEMTSLIEELVELARGDAQVPATRPVRMDLVAAEAIAAAARRAPAITFARELEPTTVTASQETLGRAIANLLDNAVKWSPAGSTIDVSVRDGQIRVSDQGPGIKDEDIPHLFDRFYRSAEARTLPGSGLGLAIVRQVVEAHGGSVCAGRADGGGAEFVATLPVVEPGHDEDPRSGPSSAE